MLIAGKTPWEFACAWYQPFEWSHFLRSRSEQANRVPREIDSEEFAEWITEQYRLAMRKGIELGYMAAVEEIAKKEDQC